MKCLPDCGMVLQFGVFFINNGINLTKQQNSRKFLTYNFYKYPSLTYYISYSYSISAMYIFDVWVFASVQSDECMINFENNGSYLFRLCKIKSFTDPSPVIWEMVAVCFNFLTKYFSLKITFFNNVFVLIIIKLLLIKRLNK